MQLQKNNSEKEIKSLKGQLASKQQELDSIQASMQLQKNGSETKITNLTNQLTSKHREQSIKCLDEELLLKKKELDETNNVLSDLKQEIQSKQEEVEDLLNYAKDIQKTIMIASNILNSPSKRSSPPSSPQVQIDISSPQLLNFTKTPVNLGSFNSEVTLTINNEG
jgi:chromosome segregation ATPase